MGRLTERDKYGLWVSTQHMTGQDTWIETYEEMSPAIIKLAHYEDMEEQGRLIELPCAVGDTVWTYWIDDEESGVMADVPMSERECVVIRSLWGKDYFATREEAVRKLEELKGE